MSGFLINSYGLRAADVTPPALVSATADVDVDVYLVVGTFSEPTQATNYVDGFAIMVDDFLCVITSGVLQVDGVTVHWTLGSGGFGGMTSSSVASVEYDGGGDVRDGANNDLASFNQAITISGTGG